MKKINNLEKAKKILFWISLISILMASWNDGRLLTILCLISALSIICWGMLDNYLKSKYEEVMDDE